MMGRHKMNPIIVARLQGLHRLNPEESVVSLLSKVHTEYGVDSIGIRKAQDIVKAERERLERIAYIRTDTFTAEEVSRLMGLPEGYVIAKISNGVLSSDNGVGFATISPLSVIGKS